ncbi:MAG: D-hexose-6-phosphate mutarotase [Methylococcales bacterium]|jgi:glucose-6-phosphate 1-epimerase|nr:D-hexose-6-phosphate mutarotase [Methylococcales bacterium]MBT7410201.1 D-hexose-6-phosphate mutarotase [Methylococcales bacterium]
MNIKDLNNHYAIDGKLAFKEKDDGLIIVNVSTDLATAELCLQGGHLLRWQPTHTKKPVIWLSDEAKFLQGKSIRGGIPVCWPWFGDHHEKNNFPAHGFARTTPWECLDAKMIDDGQIMVELGLVMTDKLNQYWPYHSRLSMTIMMGKTLKIALKTENRDDKSFVISEALHTYFAVSEIKNIHIDGMDGCDFYNKVIDDNETQLDDIRFTGETDRVYQQHRVDCVINDVDFNRQIKIKKSSSQSTVVWNPWNNKAEKMGDLGEQGWQKMVCVESANAMSDAITIEPGESHIMAVEYSVV